MTEPARRTPSWRGPGGRGLVPVGRFFGVPLYFAPSWLVIAAVITLLYAPEIAFAVPGLATGTAYLLALLYAVLFAVSVLLHELGHVAVSLTLGTQVRRVVIFLLGGVSEIVAEPRRARDEFAVAVAGPLVSLVIAAATYAGYRAAPAGGVWAVTLGLLAVGNLVVGVFNLLPGLPLDGGRLVRAVVWGASGRRLTGTRVAAWGGRVVAVGFVLALGLLTLRYSRDAGSLTTLVLAVLLGGFIWVGAGQALRMAEIQARAGRIRMTDLVRPAVAVPPGTPLAEALRRTWEIGARAVVVVDPTGVPRSVVVEQRVSQVTPDRRPWVPVTDVARPLDAASILPETLEGEALLAALQSHPVGEYLVVRVDGSTVGVLAAADVAARLSGAAT